MARCNNLAQWICARGARSGAWERTVNVFKLHKAYAHITGKGSHNSESNACWEARARVVRYRLLVQVLEVILDLLHDPLVGRRLHGEHASRCWCLAPCTLLPLGPAAAA